MVNGWNRFGGGESHTVRFSAPLKYSTVTSKGVP